MANKYAYKAKRIRGRHIDEHRYVIEKSLGRPLRSDEIVHHKDGNKRNNSLENLEILSISEHTSLHMRGRQVSTVTRQRISRTLKKRWETQGLPESAKGVVAKDRKTKEILMTFDSLTAATKQGYDKSHIIACCKGVRSSHKGFIWEYSDNPL